MILELLVAGAFALATLRRYSVAHTVIFTSFAFFLSSGLNSVSGTPAYPRLAGTVNVEPWLQPCGIEAPSKRTASQEKTSPREQTLEHDARCTMNTVLTQLGIAYDYYDMSKRKLRKIQPRIYNLTNYDYKWLPKEEIQWYRKDSMVPCLEMGKKAERILPRLYDTLQKFAVTFHHLNNARLQDANHFNPSKKFKKWNDIMRKIYNQILVMLCEVETAIQNLGLHLPTAHNDLIVTKLDKADDSTRMLVQDWGALLYYKDFLRNWKRIMTDAIKGEPGFCHPNKNLRHLRAKGAKKGKKGAGRSKKLMNARKHSRPTKDRLIASARNGTALRRPKKGPPRSRLMMRNRLKRPIDISQVCENTE